MTDTRPIVRRVGLGALVVAAALLLPVGSALGRQDVRTAFPVVVPSGGSNNGFVPKRAAILEGGAMDLYSFDLLPHDITSVAVDEDGVPLFQSNSINVDDTLRDGPAPVVGVENLAPGDWAWYCTIHPNMTGVLTVVDRP